MVKDDNNKAAEDLFPQPELQICEQPDCCGGKVEDAGDCSMDDLSQMVEDVLSNFDTPYNAACEIYEGLRLGVKEVEEQDGLDQTLARHVLHIVHAILTDQGEMAAGGLATLTQYQQQNDDSEAWKIVERLAETAKRPLGELLFFAEEIQMAMKDATHLVEQRK